MSQVAEQRDKFPFSGGLQVLATGNGPSSEMALYNPLPRSNYKGSVEPIQADTATDRSQPVKHAAELDPIFEPYHTVDYFASVGIKPPSQEHAKDRFGQQLKSFTDWLKEMKRIPLAEVTRKIPVEREKEVAALAHHSLDDKQVWTEAMAEVWIKQGERQKAIRIYEKLSLLDPSKSAYFAGKIESLKTES